MTEKSPKTQLQKQNLLLTLRHARRHRRQAGMTLIEIMIVVIIMALIATAVGIAVLPARERANRQATLTDVRTVHGAAENYMLEENECPTMENLVGEYLNRSARTEDAWGNAFQIECSGNEITVRSAGPDGQMGTEDDIQ